MDPPVQKLTFPTTELANSILLKSIISYLTSLNSDCVCKTYLIYSSEQLWSVWSIGWNAAMATKLERGHEYTYGVLFVFGEAVLVIMQHLKQVQ